MTDDASSSPGTEPAPEAEAGVASHRIAEHLRERILSGALGPGARIRQEEVAREFGASRLPVREALRILHSQGLVTLKANSGAWVSQMDMEECELTYKIRERLEPLALAESIPHLSAAVIDRLDEIQDEIEANRSIDHFLQLDRELHLLSYSGNPYRELRDMVERLWNITQPYRRAYVERAGHQRDWVINAEHRLLIDAIRRADTTDAERVLAGHIRRTRMALVPVIEPGSATGVSEPPGRANGGASAPSFRPGSVRDN
ncbi:GntR family transcriptional regulator [Sphaerisporangium viridialbum]|uniref:GntR family transcriptional regulator n=1 Tax=Sphaerisporangium viridialbum TaxID=46189 RepID=UPI003C769346